MKFRELKKASSEIKGYKVNGSQWVARTTPNDSSVKVEVVCVSEDGTYRLTEKFTARYPKQINDRLQYAFGIKIDKK